MAYMINFRVLGLLSSRICNDLISSVTEKKSIGLLKHDPSEMLWDIDDLIISGASEGVGKLKYFLQGAHRLGSDPHTDEANAYRELKFYDTAELNRDRREARNQAPRERAAMDEIGLGVYRRSSERASLARPPAIS